MHEVNGACRSLSIFANQAMVSYVGDQMSHTITVHMAIIILKEGN